MLAAEICIGEAGAAGMGGKFVRLLAFAVLGALILVSSCNAWTSAGAAPAVATAIR